MADPVLIAYRSGVVVAEIDSRPAGLTVMPAGVGVVAFDHLELHAPAQGPAIHFVTVSPDTKPTTFNALSITGSGSNLAVQFTAIARCFIGGNVAQDVSLQATLNPTTNGKWLRVAQFAFGGNPLVGPFPFTIDKLIGQINQVGLKLPCEFAAPLLTELGLRISRGEMVQVSLVPAPVAAPNSDPVSDAPDPKTTLRCPYGLRFQRKVALEAVDQRLVMGAVTIELPACVVTTFRLNGCGTKPTPITLTQTGPVVLGPSNAQSKTPETVGAVPWVVSVSGLPAMPILTTWNTAVEIYVESLQTVTDGRPNTTLPLFALSDYPPKCQCDAPGTPTGGRPSFNPWIVTVNVTDSGRPACADHPPLAPRVDFRAALPMLSNPLVPTPPDQFNVFFPGIICHNPQSPGQPLRYQFQLTTPADSTDDQAAQSEYESVGTGFVICALGLYQQLDPSQPLKPQRVRIGSLDLEFDPAAAPETLVENSITFRADPTPYTITGSTPAGGNTTVSLSTGLAVAVTAGETATVIASSQQVFATTVYAPAPVGATSVLLNGSTTFGNPDRWEETIKDRRSRFQLWFRTSRFLPVSAGLPITDTRLFLRVNQLTPGGQDDLPLSVLPTLPAGDLAAKFQREPPIVIPIAPQYTGGQFTLEGLETTRGNISQTVELELYERNPVSSPPTQTTANQQVLVVVDREPLLIARVHAPAFKGLGGADGNREVGNWLNVQPNGASWQLASSLNGFTLVFPPQGIGEGSEKRSNRGVADGLAVGFRLSPAAQFQLIGSASQQNFTEAAWNLRRLLGYPAQPTPGAIVKSLAFELLYGLNCQVRTAGLWVAELAARIGAIPGPLPDSVSRPFGGGDVDDLGELDTAFQEYQAVWADQFSAYQSRLGIFEPWNTAAGTLTISDKLQYALRALASGQQLYPDPAGVATIAPNSPLLPGGVLWGLEFESQYQELLANPTATGELSRPSFSALGGWGYQKAVFANGLTTFYSDTAMGRTFYYSVEQRGRIAQYWNYAKHVVVYERTVAPSAQFAGTTSTPSEQDHLPGRPVLRKVREFVELLQPIRNYPDFNAKPVATGCVQGIEFKTRIIPVDSAWGRDVYTYVSSVTSANPYQSKPQGYVLPLWNRAAANPAVYPKPHVSLRVAGASESGQTFPLEIAEPEKLLFYADTTASTADTDQWPSVRGIDFPDLAIPASDPIDLHPGADLDAATPSEVPIHSGYESYTYAVIGQQLANVVATRSTQPVGVMLSNVTMIRSAPATPPADLTSPAAAAASGISSLYSTRQQLTKLVSSLPSQPSAADLSQLSALFTNAVNTATQGTQALTNSLSAVLQTMPRWTNLAQGTVQRWQAGATTFLNGMLSGPAAVLSQIQKIQDSTLADADKLNLAQSVLGDQLDLLNVTVPTLDPGIQPLQDLLGRVSQVGVRVQDALTATVNGAIAQFNQLLQGVDESATLRQDLQASLLEAATDLAQQATAAVTEAVGQARNAAAGMFRDLPGLIGQSSQTVIDVIADVTRDLNDAIHSQDVTTLTKLLDPTSGAIVVLVNQAQSAFSSLATPIQNLQNSLLDEANSFLATTLTGPGTLGAFVNEMKDRLIGVLTNPATLVQDLTDQLTNELTTATSGLTQLVNQGFGGFANGMGGVAGLLQKIDPSMASQALSGLSSQLNNLLTQQLPVDNLRQQIGDLINQGQGALDDLTNQLAEPLAAQFPAGLAQTAGNVLNLARAFGDAPNVAGLGFNRDQLGYFFNPIAAALTANLPIDISPVNALMNRVGDELKSVGARLPATQLLDQVLPASDDLLQNFSLGNLLPDFAGLKLDKLFPDLTAPAGLKDKVKITHQFDEQKASGWVQADVNIPEDGPTTLFDAGPIRISVANIVLSATMRIEAGLGGSPQHSQSGQLKADWDLNIAGTDVITFKDTSLTFDNSGHTHFNLDPKKIQLNGVLAMLSQALQAANDPAGGSDDSTTDDDSDDDDDNADAQPQAGLTFKLVEDHGAPIGVLVDLEIPLPDVTFGVCGLTNLSFGASLELVAQPEFALSIRAHVAEKTAPFTIIIFILDGGGWFDVHARYLPFSNRITTALSIGISAGAELAIDFAVVEGSVYAYFYVEAELQTDSAAPGIQLKISIGLVLGGNVNALGIVSVSIQLLLELSYSTDDHALTGRGTISLSIKICWLITINVNASVEKRFATIGGGSSSATHAQVAARVQSHLSSLE